MSGKRTNARVVAQTIHAVGYLWRLDLGSRVGSTQVVFLRHARPSYQVSTSDPGLGNVVFDRGQALLELTHPSLPADQRI